MLWLWVLYGLLVVGVLTWGGLVGLRFKNTLKQAQPPAILPRVSVVVPARNEERNLARCILGLRNQDYPNIELIFVDDDSTDQTPTILARQARQDPRVKVAHTGGRPSGWNGKQWACHCGAEIAGGDWLCFMDADTFAEPQLIAQTVAFATASHVDMLTLQPWYEMQGLWERIVLPTGLPPLLLVFPPHRVNDPKDRLSMANGQFILIRREVYEAIEGHAGVRDQLMDDYPLAERVKASGYRLYVAFGPHLMRVRMYTNLGEIWAGALKASVRLTGGWLISLASVLGNLLINVLPVMALAWALFTANWPVAVVMGATVMLQLSYYAALRVAAFRLPPWSSITYPLGSLIVALIILDGMIRLAAGRDIQWKGRSMLGRPELPVRRG